jgi:hypothetical protein
LKNARLQILASVELPQGLGSKNPGWFWMPKSGFWMLFRRAKSGFWMLFDVFEVAFEWLKDAFESRKPLSSLHFRQKKSLPVLPLKYNWSKIQYCPINLLTC